MASIQYEVSATDNASGAFGRIAVAAHGLVVLSLLMDARNIIADAQNSEGWEEAASRWRDRCREALETWPAD